jgi:colanic acid biosynthesis glycosyl transferase WcaI
MRILIQSINFSPEMTGIGKYSGEMAEWLASRGHEVRVVSAPPHYPQWRIYGGHHAWRFGRDKHILPAGTVGTLDVFRCPVWIPRVPRGWKRILHLATFSLSSWPTMLRQVPWKPDVVLLVAPTIVCFPQALGVALLTGATSWLHVQDFEVDAAFQLGDFSSNRLRRWVHSLERFILRRFNRISSISARMIERLSAKGVDPARTVLFPNWVDTSVIFPMLAPSPLRKELGIPEGATVVLYSGNMGRKQGLELLVDASRRLEARTDIRFVFCGDGSYRQTFVQTATKNENVIILPLQPTERLNALLNLADIHVLPQVSGAADLVMPSKLTGMMASGRSIVATALPGTQLFGVLEGRGIITPPGDVDAFVAALIRLADTPSLRQQIGEEARSYAIRHLNRDLVLRQFELSLLKACRFSSPDIPTGSCATESGDQSIDETVVPIERVGEA